MPDKPLWFDRLPQAIRSLQAMADPWVGRAEIESLLGVGRRRAQQLLAPLAGRVGTSLVARRVDVTAHLERVARGEAAWYEGRRQKRLWTGLDPIRDAWAEQPPVLVEVTPAQMERVERRDLEGLPDGVELAPGSIRLRFSTPEEALQKLAALAMAIGRNRAGFEERVALPDIPL